MSDRLGVCDAVSARHARQADVPSVVQGFPSASPQASELWRSHAVSGKERLGRACSSPGSGYATPTSWRPLTATRSQSVSRSCQRCVQTTDSPVAGIRTQWNGLQDRCTEEMSLVQGVSVARLEEKVMSLESGYLAFDRRLAEVSGACKGNSDGLQSQIRRVDAMETRLMEVKFQIEDELRRQRSDVEQELQKAFSAIRASAATYDDDRKQNLVFMHRLEHELETHPSRDKLLQEGFAAVHARLDAIDNRSGAGASYQDPEHVPIDALHCADSGSRIARERWLTEMESRFETAREESNGFHARLEELEERFKGMRTLLDTRENQWRGVEGLVQHTISEVQACCQDRQDSLVGRARQQEELKLLREGLDGESQAREELQRGQENILQTITQLCQDVYNQDDVPWGDAQVQADETIVSATVSASVEELRGRLTVLEARVGNLRRSQGHVVASIEANQKAQRQMSPIAGGQDCWVSRCGSEQGQCLAGVAQGDDRIHCRSETLWATLNCEEASASAG